MSNKERFQWSAAENGWKDKSGKIIPFKEMSDSQLRKTFRLAQHKELTYLNKYMVFCDKVSEMAEEAERRGIAIKAIDTDHHRNKFKHTLAHKE